MNYNNLKVQDPPVYKLVQQEVKRQQEGLVMIPSENFASLAVLEAMGTALTNKYAEGYPGKRYYTGNQFIDQMEQLAIDRAKKLFGAEHANVQPHSGSTANQACYAAVLKPGDKVLALNLAHGGHLTHGSKVNFSGQTYQFIPYGVRQDTEMIDLEEVRETALCEKPKMIVSGATAYPRIIDFKKIGEIAHRVGAYHMADISHIAGLVASDVHPSPFPYADAVMATTHKTLRGPRGAVIWVNRESPIAKRNKIDIATAVDKAVFPGLQGGPHNNTTAAIAWTFGEVATPKFRAYARQIIKNAKVLASELMKFGFNLVSGGTDNHLMLVDLRNKNITGLEAEKLLESAGIIANRNAVPGDDKPFKPSGIRIGTPSVTSRGMKEKEMKHIGEFIYRCLIKRKDIDKEVVRICKRFPLPYK